MDTDWKNHRCAQMRCKPLFYLTPSFSWNDNWHLSFVFPGMNWCNSVGKKIPLKGLPSLSYGNNWNGWCYVIVLIWIWLTETIVTRPVMTLSMTKKRNMKPLLCNLDLIFFDVTIRLKNVNLLIQKFIPRREVLDPHLGSAILEFTTLAKIIIECKRQNV